MAFHRLTEVVFREAVLVSTKPIKKIVGQQIAMMNARLQNHLSMPLTLQTCSRGAFRIQVSSQSNEDGKPFILISYSYVWQSQQDTSQSKELDIIAHQKSQEGR
jgi:hypothetical protein